MSGARLCSCRHGEKRHSISHHVGLRRVQGTELYDREESAERSGAVRVQKVLSPVPHSHTASGDKISGNRGVRGCSTHKFLIAGE